MKKENYDEPIYENLELYSGLDLVYRHPCLHFRVDSHECSNCKYGKANKCRIYEEYQKISKDLEVLEQLKEILSMDYLVRVYGYEMAKRLQTYLKSNDIVKEWLDA